MKYSLFVIEGQKLESVLFESEEYYFLYEKFGKPPIFEGDKKAIERYLDEVTYSPDWHSWEWVPDNLTKNQNYL